MARPSSPRRRGRRRGLRLELIIGMRVGEGPAPAAPGPVRAYNVRTGELVWRFHTIPQPGEFGHVFVFDRETGDPLFPIEERAVPPSELQGESAWPTQPLPLKPAPFARQLFSYDEITDISPESHRAVLDRLVKVRPHTPFAPPSEQGTIVFPGFDGGAEWGGGTGPESTSSNGINGKARTASIPQSCEGKHDTYGDR